MIYVGIDCGKQGGIAVIKGFDVQGQEYSRKRLAMLCSKLWGRDDYIVYVENAHDAVRGLMNPQRVFSQGYNTGEVIGILYASGVKFKEVTPRKWQQGIDLYGNGKDKETTAALMVEYYGCDDLFYTKRGRLIDGISDAMGIAHYAKVANNDWK